MDWINQRWFADVKLEYSSRCVLIAHHLNIGTWKQIKWKLDYKNEQK